LALSNNKHAVQGLKSAAADAAPAVVREAKKGRGQLRARPIGVGHAAPEMSISNADMEKIVETTGSPLFCDRFFCFFVRADAQSDESLFLKGPAL